MKNTPACYLMPTALSSILQFEKDEAVQFDTILGKLLHYIQVRHLMCSEDKYTVVPNAELAAVFGDNRIRIIDLPGLLRSKLQVVAMSG